MPGGPLRDGRLVAPPLGAGAGGGGGGAVSGAAGIGAPVDTATLQVRDLEGFVQSARNGRRLGFQGKLCLHPDQIPPCHGVYTPDAAQVTQAQRILAAYEAALEAGHAAIEVDGTFVDEPVAERARRLLRRAQTRRLSNDV